MVFVVCEHCCIPVYINNALPTHIHSQNSLEFVLETFIVNVFQETKRLCLLCKETWPCAVLRNIVLHVLHI